MSTLAEALTGHHFVKHGEDDSGPWGEHVNISSQTASHLAAVVAEWLESDEAVEVVTSHARNSVGGCICGERSVGEPFARHALAALAARAKGEVS